MIEGLEDEGLIERGAGNANGDGLQDLTAATDDELAGMGLSVESFG